MTKQQYFDKYILSKWQLYSMLLIPVVYILIFHYQPMLGAQIAFKKFRISLGIWGSPWVGFDNFMRFFRSYQFMRVLKNTLYLSFYSLIAGFPLPIILALGLNAVKNQTFKKFVQTVTYIPHFISTIIIVGMMLQLFNARIGVFPRMYTAMTGKEALDIFAVPELFSHLYVWSGIWQSVGWSSIVYLAALSSVDPEITEAATVDGANRFQRVMHIDLPSIIPTAVILLILNAGRIMNVGFEKAFLMQNNLNLSRSEIISTYVYNVAMGGGNDFSLATAIGLFNSVINLILIMFVNFVAKKLGETSLW